MKRKILVLALLAVGFSLILCVMWMFQEATIRASNSPDGKYSLVILKRKLDFLPVMPGQGSDVKCFVELRWREDGKIILRKDVDMLQNVEYIQWDADRVWINSHSAISYEGKQTGIW